ncbi:hypothetical protein KIW84_020687 [Lathyrus oleraceus]|uniref:Uncharacterized protein n=1 Tax=Pisum sativum TaxID=3888 RepID=A0A9D4Y5Q6_PEA|nr:hypothetical protein KIW84_020687 [Pisum sativum]
MKKKHSLRQLLDLIDMSENAFGVVGSHSQTVPVLVSLLQSGSLNVKIQAATLLGSLCKENELNVKVLLEGYIPPLLNLLKSSSEEGQVAAAKTIFAVSQGAFHCFENNSQTTQFKTFWLDSLMDSKDEPLASLPWHWIIESFAGFKEIPLSTLQGLVDAAPVRHDDFVKIQRNCLL